MKNVWVAMLLLLPALGWAQVTIESEEYKFAPEPVSDPELKLFEQYNERFKCDPPEPMINPGDSHFDPDNPKAQFNSPIIHYSNGITYNRHDGSYSVEGPDLNGQICTFTAYYCKDGEKSQWDDEWTWFYNDVRFNYIGEERFKEIYCLKKENCNPQE